ncbi:hypothetical protein KIW84_011658 [Lathyrus oleraceus]|uniref:Replication protein A 70 kDa DNA-binding subunit B/D first OB fold domain-containing protein n=1 Tax=Pisum sativum TaxID=3888 RepID=A0A9D5BFI7_PEA|nr:hypothetical protein KIW84_011658 [Pisum sativum]
MQNSFTTTHALFQSHSVKRKCDGGETIFTSSLFCLSPVVIQEELFPFFCFIHLILRFRRLQVMARPFEKIVDINEIKELWKVAVKVHHKWTVISNNKEHIELIFVDAEGIDVHVIVPTTLKAMFDSILLVNNTYTMTNFLPQSNDLMFKTSEHPYVIRNDTLNCTLWETYAVKFMNYVQMNKDGGPIIIMLQYAKVKAGGKYPFSVSNTYNITNLLINEDVPDIVEFRNSSISQIENELTWRRKRFDEIYIQFEELHNSCSVKDKNTRLLIMESSVNLVNGPKGKPVAEVEDTVVDDQVNLKGLMQGCKEAPSHISISTASDSSDENKIGDESIDEDLYNRPRFVV